jgi:hypothetical protein
LLQQGLEKYPCKIFTPLRRPAGENDGVKALSFIRLDKRFAVPLFAFLLLAIYAAPAQALQGWQVAAELPANSIPTQALITSSGESTLLAGGEVFKKGPGGSWERLAGLEKGVRRIGADGAGDLIAVSPAAPHHCDAFVVRTSHPGGFWSERVGEVNGPPCPNPGEPQLAVDAAGDVAIAWTNLAASQSVVEVVTKPAGGHWSESRQLSAAGEEAQSPPQVAIDPAGDVTVVWADESEFPHQLRGVDKPAGGEWSEPESISPPGDDAREPQLAVARSGEAFAAWCSGCGGSNYGGVVRVASRAPGGSWTPPQDLSPSTRTARGPRIAVDPAGDVTAAWYFKSSARVQAAYRPAGGSWGSPLPLSEEGAEVKDPPAIAVDAGGDAIVAWEAVVKDVGITPVAQAAVRPRGSGWNPPATLSPPGGGEARTPVAAIDSAGNGLVVWRAAYEGGLRAVDYIAKPAPGPPPTPRLTRTAPVSPSKYVGLRIQGYAPAASTVSVFTNSTCSGTPVAGGSGSELAYPGLATSVRASTATLFYANATQEGETSSCSGPLTYISNPNEISMTEALAAMAPLDALTNPEDPLVGQGSWAALAGTSGPGFVSATGWASHQPFPAIEGAYWTPSVFPAFDTPWGSVAAARLIASPGFNGRYFSLWLEMPSPATEQAGYELRFTQIGNNTYNAELKKWSNGSASTLATVEDVVLPLGSSFALADYGGNLLVWVDAGAGYVKLALAHDSSFKTGYAGIAASGAGTRLRRFSAGALPIVVQF